MQGLCTVQTAAAALSPADRHTMVAPKAQPGGQQELGGCSPYVALGRPLRRMMAR